MVTLVSWESLASLSESLGSLSEAALESLGSFYELILIDCLSNYYVMYISLITE